MYTNYNNSTYIENFLTKEIKDSLFLQNYDVFIIDSVSDAHLTPEDIEAMQKQYPQLSLILIFHTTKDGQFRGLNTWEHWVQTVVEVKDGIATTGKNRFGAKGEINIFD